MLAVLVRPAGLVDGHGRRRRVARFSSVLHLLSASCTHCSVGCDCPADLLAQLARPLRRRR